MPQISPIKSITNYFFICIFIFYIPYLFILKIFLETIFRIAILFLKKVKKALYTIRLKPRIRTNFNALNGFILTLLLRKKIDLFIRRRKIGNRFRPGGFISQSL